MKHSIFTLMALLTMLCTCAACSSSSDDPQVTNGPLTGITLQFGPSDAATTRSYGDDPNALEHEFINSLTVVVVNSSGQVELLLTPTAAELGSEATEGNLIEKTFSNLSLTAGQKTIYAFANLDRLKDINGVSLSTHLAGITQGSVFPTSIDDIVVSDPAATVNFDEGGYLPMAVKQNVSINTNGQTVRIEMVRLVSRISLTVRNNKTETPLTLSSLTVGNFATQVSLFEPSTTTSYPRATTPMTVSGAASQTIAAGQSLTLPDFYVNATEDQLEAFAVSVDVQGDKLYQGNTVRTDLPRNSILPILLNFADYTLEIVAEAQIAPIGGYPITVYSSGALTNNLSINLPEGCTFTITPTLYDAASNIVANHVCSWALKDSYSWLTWTNSSDASNKQAFYGQVAARSGMTGSLTLHSEADINGRTRQGDYDITLKTVPIDNSTSSLSRARTTNHWTKPTESEYISVKPLR